MSIDWGRICLNLRTAGVSSKVIMRKTGVSDKTICKWRNGKIGEPRFSRGVELLKLHQQFCEEQHRREVYEKI